MLLMTAALLICLASKIVSIIFCRIPTGHYDTIVTVLAKTPMERNQGRKFHFYNVAENPGNCSRENPRSQVGTKNPNHVVSWHYSVLVVEGEERYNYTKPTLKKTVGFQLDISISML